MTPAEIELLASLRPAAASGRIWIVHDVDAALRALEATFPFPDNRLEWTRVSRVESAGGLGAPEQSATFVRFLSERADREALSGNVMVIGDGQVEFAVCGSIPAVLDILPLITDFPQHTYVFPYPDVAWCASLTMEGYMYFGYAPGIAR